MFSIMSRAAKSAHDDNAVVTSSGGEASLKSSPQNTKGYHVWIFRGSILAGVLILVALIFIKFPANLILFVVSLFLFLGVSFWYHVMVHRKKREQQSSVSSSRFGRGGGGDNSSFVDVPLEQFNEYDHYNGSDGLNSSHNSHVKHQHLVSA